MKFSSSTSIFAIVATLASFAKGAHAQYCPPDEVFTKTIPFTKDFQTLLFSFTNLPEAEPGTLVTIDGVFSGDINYSNEYADVTVGGTALFTLGNKSTSMMQSAGNSDCWTDRASTTMGANVFNGLRSAPIDVKLDTTNNVHEFCLNDYGTITITISPKCCHPVTETQTIPFTKDFQTLLFSFPNLPAIAAAGTTVKIDGVFSGDINYSNEYADVTVGGTALFTLGNKSTSMMQSAGNSDCWTDRASTTLTAAQYNNLNMNSVNVKLDTTNNVHEFCLNDYGTITVTVTPASCMPSSSSGGDPHITTWNNEHFEYHGQCDLTLVKDADFANGLGLDVQIRTKIVRYWSYIKNVAIKIGNDILEIEGSADADDVDAHHWINYEYQGDLDTFAGFPVTQELPSVHKRKYIIDLSSKYPGSSVVVQLYKEFVRVKLIGGEEVFGNTVGLMGDYKTGSLLARDGSTAMTDFTEFGDEWQVLPSEPKLFHEFTHPQFPELCIKPEDPRGERKRRLAESAISVEQAEAACAPLKDALSIKDCVYDILATQDLDMVGAF